MVLFLDLGLFFHTGVNHSSMINLKTLMFARDVIRYVCTVSNGNGNFNAEKIL